MADVQITPAALAFLGEILRDCQQRGVGGDVFLRNFKLHCNQHGWDWFAPESKQQFNRRAMLLFRAFGAAEYARMRWSQLAEATFKWWVYRAYPDCPGAHAPFDGIALPPAHAFWLRHYPPTCGLCGCYVVGTGTGAGIARLGGDASRALPPGWEMPFDGESDIWRFDTQQHYLAVLGVIAGGELDHCI